MAELLVDARYLEPPEPFVLAMEALAELDGAAASPKEAAIDRVRLLLFREPYPLYKVLDEHGYTRQTTVADDGTCTVLIGRRPA